MRTQRPLVHCIFAGHAALLLHGIASQRCAAEHWVRGFVHEPCAEQPGTQAPWEHMPIAQSWSVAHTLQDLAAPTVPTQCGAAVGQSVSTAHSVHCRKLWPNWLRTLVHAGRAAGQSVFEAHSVQVPLLHTDALLAPASLSFAVGHAMLTEHTAPLPVGTIGGLGQTHCPHHCGAPQPALELGGEVYGETQLTICIWPVCIGKGQSVLLRQPAMPPPAPPLPPLAAPPFPAAPPWSDAPPPPADAPLPPVPSPALPAKPAPAEPLGPLELFEPLEQPATLAARANALRHTRIE